VIGVEVGADPRLGVERVSGGVGPRVAGRSLDAGELVIRVLEGVQDSPLVGRQIGEQIADCGRALNGNEGRVHLVSQCGNPPPVDGDGFAVGVAVDEDADDVRKEQASVDEEWSRVRRWLGQTARTLPGRLG
jgi:hypothetical protein